MKCCHICEEANKYLDGELKGWALVKMRLHLFLCRNCCRYVKQLQATMQAMRALNRPSGREDTVEEILRRLEEEAHDEPVPHEQPR